MNNQIKPILNGKTKDKGFQAFCNDFWARFRLFLSVKAGLPWFGFGLESRLAQGKFIFQPILVLFTMAVLSTQAQPQQRATVSFYCSCPVCCGQWSVLNRTASGTVPRPGRTVAAPRGVPFGTRIYIAGIGWRVAEDRTAPQYDGRFDVFVSNHSEAKRLGLRKASISIDRIQ